MRMFVTILQLLCGIAVIAVVLMQSGKSAGLSGAIGGVADSFLAKNKAHTMDAKLARATKWVGALYLILTLVLLIMAAHSDTSLANTFPDIDEETIEETVDTETEEEETAIEETEEETDTVVTDEAED